jgi:predicted enzyme related to lactoylglutathione lyase
MTGAFVWHDLMSTDVERARDFYIALFGWSVRTVPGPFPYHVLSAGTHDVAGIVPFDSALGWPSHWMPYVGVDSVDEHTQRAAAHGGHLGVPPTDIPIGRFAVVSDPTGGTYSPLAPKTEHKPTSAKGTFVWHQLLTGDVKQALAYYRAVLGWEQRGPAAGRLAIVGAGHHDVAAILASPTAELRASWLSYVAVDDLDGVIARAIRLGATLAREVTDLPPLGSFALLRDPTGAELGVIVRFVG